MKPSERKNRESINTANIQVFDFNGECITTYFQDYINGEKLVQRRINKNLFDILNKVRKKKVWNRALNKYVCNTNDHELAMINSYIATGEIDDSYESKESNPCVITEDLDDEIIRLRLGVFNKTKN